MDILPSQIHKLSGLFQSPIYKTDTPIKVCAWTEKSMCKSVDLYQQVILTWDQYSGHHYTHAIYTAFHASF